MDFIFWLRHIIFEILCSTHNSKHGTFFSSKITTNFAWNIVEVFLKLEMKRYKMNWDGGECIYLMWMKCKSFLYNSCVVWIKKENAKKSMRRKMYQAKLYYWNKRLLLKRYFSCADPFIVMHTQALAWKTLKHLMRIMCRITKKKHTNKRINIILFHVLGD